jgi:hypothetical protein
MKDYKELIKLSRWDKFLFFFFKTFNKISKKSYFENEFYCNNVNKHIHLYDNGNLAKYVCTNKKGHIYGVYIFLNKDGSKENITHWNDGETFGQQSEYEKIFLK